MEKTTLKIKVMNRYIDGKRLDIINSFLRDKFFCKSVSNDDGLVTDDPKASTIIHIDDELVVECEKYDVKTVVAFIGKEATDDSDDGRMTRDKALIELRRLQKSGDTECAHSGADGVLCKLLETLGFEDVVAEYHRVDKWYS